MAALIYIYVCVRYLLCYQNWTIARCESSLAFSLWFLIHITRAHRSSWISRIKEWKRDRQRDRENEKENERENRGKEEISVWQSFSYFIESLLFGMSLSENLRCDNWYGVNVNQQLRSNNLGNESNVTDRCGNIIIESTDCFLCGH